MGKTMSLHNLRETLTKPGCAVCRLSNEATEGFFRSLLWESVNDPDARSQIRQAWGFCHQHAWQLAQHQDSLGIAIINRDVLGNALRTIEEAQYQALPPVSLRRARESLSPGQPAAATAELVAQLTPRASCPACVQEEKTEVISVRALVKHLLAEKGLLAAYQSSDGLCLPHFRQALTYVRTESVFEALVSGQRAIWERLVDHLSQAIRKCDHRFKDEPRGEEVGAWLRSTTALAGERGDRRDAALNRNRRLRADRRLPNKG